MRSLLRSAAGALLVACALALAASPQAHAQAGIEVTIKTPQGESESILTSEIAGDINATYKIEGGRTVAVAKGVSLRQVLEKTSTDFSYETISVARPNGTTLVMTKDQIEDPRNQPVFYVDASGATSFIGPREPGASVVAARNYFPVGSAVAFTQENKSPLQVSISPTSKKIALGGSVSFRATVKRNDDGDPLVYTWGISGKKQTQTSSPTFTQKFPSKDGVYKFFVSARIEGSAVSQTAVAKITVGDPDKAEQEQTGNGDATTGSDTGTGTGTGTGSGTGSYDSGSAYTPSYTPSTPSTPPATPATPSTPPPDVPDIATSGTTVEGNLLADVNESPPSSILESAARAAREGKQKSDDSASDGANVSEAALSVVGLLALLALGAGIETRQGRLPRWRLPGPRRGA